MASLTAFSVGIACVCAAMAFGPLTPPGGPVASTAKPLSEVEPRIAINATNTPGDPIGDASPSLFKITQPGSYYLTGNITGVAGKHGIEIASSGVTLDLNGFDLVGIAGMGAFDGVSVTVTNLSNIAVVNGSVRNWGDEGIDLGSFFALNCSVRDVRSSGNGGTGIYGGSVCIISGCAVYGNTFRGISTGTGSSITGCTVSANTGDGIEAGAASTVSGCTAYANGAYGISTLAGCSVSGCASRSNTLDGIRVTSQCIILSNTCGINGNGGDGAGIHATGSDNRIEGNTCTGADRGIDVDLSGNIIIRNTCSGNTIDWEIAANNIYGPIIDRRIPAPVASTPAVSGTAAASTLGSTEPNANFTY